MKCPNCGASVEHDGAPFCPHCGHNLAGKRSRRKLRFILLDVQDDKRFRHLASAVVIAVMVAAVLSVLLVQWDEPRDPQAESHGSPSSPPESAVVVSDTDYIELYGNFLDGALSASLTENGELRIDLDTELAEGYDRFTWILRDVADNTYQYVTKDRTEDGYSTLHWMSPEIGRYNITVKCESTQTGDTAVYGGNIHYLGRLNEQYSFLHDGQVYTVRIDIGLDEFLGFREADAPRYSGSAVDAALFAVSSESIERLAANLMDQYKIRHMGVISDRSDYAQYVLTFVRGYVTLSSDIVLYERSEYWAYPVETLYNGAGDEGDLCVLAITLLKESGFNTGLTIIHGHTMAAINLDRFTGPEDVPDGYHTVRITVGTTPYYLCDLSADVPLGCVDEAYGYDRGKYLYYGTDVSKDSGFGLPPAEA